MVLAGNEWAYERCTKWNSLAYLTFADDAVITFMNTILLEENLNIRKRYGKKWIEVGLKQNLKYLGLQMKWEEMEVIVM